MFGIIWLYSDDNQLADLMFLQHLIYWCFDEWWCLSPIWVSFSQLEHDIRAIRCGWGAECHALHPPSWRKSPAIATVGHRLHYTCYHHREKRVDHNHGPNDNQDMLCKAFWIHLAHCFDAAYHLPHRWPARNVVWFKMPPTLHKLCTTYTPIHIFIFLSLSESI